VSQQHDLARIEVETSHSLPPQTGGGSQVTRAVSGAGLELEDEERGLGRDDRAAADEGIVLETRKLGKRYGERIVAVDRLTMRVRRGEVYGFLGPNG
jgi:ATPase subunit of ABC transporter with duplicated ATPase domains